MWVLRSSTSKAYRGVQLLHSETLKVYSGMSCVSVHPYSPRPVSESGICEAASGPPPGLGCSSSVCLCGAESAPSTQHLNSTPGSPRSLTCVAGNGLHHPGPCRYAYAGWPAPYTKDGLLEVRAVCPPTTCTIVDCPCEVLEMASIIHVQQGQGIEHAGLLQPVPLLGALLHG